MYRSSIDQPRQEPGQIQQRWAPRRFGERLQTPADRSFQGLINFYRFGWRERGRAGHEPYTFSCSDPAPGNINGPGLDSCLQISSSGPLYLRTVSVIIVSRPPAAGKWPLPSGIHQKSVAFGRESSAERGIIKSPYQSVSIIPAQPCPPTISN